MVGIAHVYIQLGVYKRAWHVGYSYREMEVVFCFVMCVANTGKNKKRTKRDTKTEISHVEIQRRRYGLENIGVDGRVVDAIEDKDHFEVTGSSQDGVQITHLSSEVGFIVRDGVNTNVSQSENFLLCVDDQYFMASGVSYVKIGSHSDTVGCIGEDDTDDDVSDDDGDDVTEAEKLIEAQDNEFINDEDDVSPDMAMKIAKLVSVHVVPMSLQEGHKMKLKVDEFVLPAVKPLTKRQKKMQEASAAHMKELTRTTELRKQDASIHKAEVDKAFEAPILELEEIHKLSPDDFYAINQKAAAHWKENRGF